MKRIREGLFLAICLLFSGVLLLSSLFCAARLTRFGEEEEKLEREIAALERENAGLRARLEMSCSLTEIERYAREELGMQAPGDAQIIFLPPP